MKKIGTVAGASVAAFAVGATLAGGILPSAAGMNEGVGAGTAIAASGSSKLCQGGRSYVVDKRDKINKTAVPKGSYKIYASRVACSRATSDLGKWLDSGKTSGGWKVKSAGRSIKFTKTRGNSFFVARRVKSHAIVNTWVGPPADTSRLPIGTSKVSLTGASVGGLYACDAGNPNGGGAHAVGPWINEAAGTWNMSEKVAVRGSVSWPEASYSHSHKGTKRSISSNGLPVDDVTGNFPIAPDDPAYAYDRNPNRIASSPVTLSLPMSPTEATKPGCLGKGRVGILDNGVSLFAPIDERNRDAVAYETQDKCDGHPQQTSTYHYHDIPSCIRDAATSSSTVVGFAYDGFPIVVERNAQGQLPTNADLDECHGRTSLINLDGETVTMYHYSATYEFPYFIGCYRGTPVQ